MQPQMCGKDQQSCAFLATICWLVQENDSFQVGVVDPWNCEFEPSNNRPVSLSKTVSSAQHSTPPCTISDIKCKDISTQAPLRVADSPNKPHSHAESLALTQPACLLACQRKPNSLASRSMVSSRSRMHSASMVHAGKWQLEAAAANRRVAAACHFILCCRDLNMHAASKPSNMVPDQNCAGTQQGLCPPAPPTGVLASRAAPRETLQGLSGPCPAAAWTPPALAADLL